MTHPDIASVLQIQATCYLPNMIETESVIRTRLERSSDSAWVIENKDKTLCGYLVAYRSMLGKLTALDTAFKIPPQPDCLYLHDLAILPIFQNQKLGQQLVELAHQFALKEKLFYSALISVQNTALFWQKRGYQIWNKLDDVQLAYLKTYQTPAYYMVRHVK